MCLAQGLARNRYHDSNIIPSLFVVLSEMTMTVLWDRGNQQLPFLAPVSTLARGFPIPLLCPAGGMEGETVENGDHSEGNGWQQLWGVHSPQGAGPGLSWRDGGQPGMEAEA